MVARRGSRGDHTVTAITLASALVFAALAGLAIGGRPLPIDDDVKGWVERAQYPAIGAGMHAVSTLGESAGLIPLIGLVSAIAWRQGRRRALSVPLVMIGAGLLQLAAKWAVDRPRPNLAPWGFPSGHVLSLVVLLGLLCYLLASANVGRRWQVLVGALSTTAVLAVALSRLYLDMHWLSDVVGGFAVGLAYLLLVSRWLARLAPVRVRHTG